MKSIFLAALLAAAAAAAHAQNVSLAGRMGDRALLVMGGQTMTLGVGASSNGVKLVRWVGDEAEVEVGGRRSLLRVGGSPVQVGGAAPLGGGAREIVMTAGPGGHFITSGAINGRPVRFMVDTGATRIAMGLDEAQRLGLDLTNAEQGMVGTANGNVRAQSVVLSRVRVGEVELTNISAVIVAQPMPYILLGNNFLSRFQMQRDNDVMRLQLR
jgi:aspartyl protease family protein